MDTITVKDGTQIYYKDWGTGQPLFFHHGWPLSADDWDAQMMFFLERGYRVIAHDRRGHAAPPRQSPETTWTRTRRMCRVGRETQPERRDPHRPFHRRRRGRALRQGTGRRGHPDQRGSACDGQVRQKPGGLPIEVLDQIRQSTAYNRPQYYQDFTLPFYGYNRPGAKISQGIRDNWWRQGMMGGIKAQYDCISLLRNRLYERPQEN